MYCFILYGKSKFENCSKAHTRKNVWFQKIFIPTLTRTFGNSKKGKGSSKKANFEGKL